MDARRQQVIDEAMTWRGTPWHHAANIKGAGVDCGYFPLEVYAACGLILPSVVDAYPADWALHRDEERYLAVVERYCRPVDVPLPADIVVYQYGRSYSHGGIVIEWPRIIHAVMGSGVVLAAGDKGDLVAKGRSHLFFSYFTTEDGS
jgi:cell wall-associated NlpC family hydrolase